ncbi:hypothetical protein [Caldisalinibacter kiritimatiensis]|uniref:Uncharacterized protein n=1 Tax=Caldisalinibacter kiritimatiensis TaxID=1304284 RepID=R1CAF4_9FIRM|nr:hypothetical protein [Caldisalinibacter kiritimatiensis]EOC99304.1 hypothetical protein L21TH_2653 [Caldisalinibacter kiritimatiensis]
MVRENKSSRRIKNIVIVIFTILFVPLLTTSILYYSNNTFKNATNEIMKKTPGVIGDYFSKFPTEEEKEEKKKYLAKYYTSLESKIAADKIYIVKKNDEELFNDIVSYMNTISTRKTKEILKYVRNIELRKDLLFSIYDEIQNEKESEFNNEVKKIEEMDTYLAIKEIERRITQDSSSIKLIADIMATLNEKKAAEILYYLKDDIKLKLTKLIDSDKMYKINQALENKTLKNKEFMELAKNYGVKDSKKAYEEIGNKDKYKIDELAMIYLNLPEKKAAEILRYSKDEEFIEELFTEIRYLERFEDNIKESRTVRIRKNITFLNEYEEKITDLAKVYENMNSNEVADIVEKMMFKDDTLSLFFMEDSYQYQISDASIILDVIKKMKKSSVSDILGNMDARKAAELTKKLALPE